ncbi:hypothetical protein GCM10023187_29890 [Nibrella viscosa]|uniref:site-specific DNA-methyltransferase (adenine-specific) n=1 Tax=Nibrella viscosa TaxID=1084524 RepID=A0ABP8KKI3_9BACT
MSITKQEFTQYIQAFRFKELFIDIGWNRDRTNPSSVVIGKETFVITPITEKQGFKILLCSPQADGRIPDYATRKQIHTRVVKLYQEHFIIYTDARQHEQLWQVPVRRAGQPLRLVETRWNKNQAPELLYQRAAGLFISLDEEGNITIVDIRQRVAANFEQNAEKVTKKFYEGFKREHTAFLKFIEGIEDQVNREWYASLMLNRLMFCYFIQKKGFLDSDLNYLSSRLKRCQEKRGKNKFYTFYRDFLLVLFHHGLGAPDRTPELFEEVGLVPYLNGGFFDKHELEEAYPTIQIDDKAFEGLFSFFDQWNWHLDDRHTADGKQINPDVIGYIFERYINDRAGMGAYYTKEDITDYIGKNCIIPYLFDETQRRYANSFTDAFAELRLSGDTYIYEAVKHGVEHNLPANIEQGLNPNQPDLLEKRREWNKPAPAEVALPTEIWREVIERRKRYAEVSARIANGDVNSINDFITYNLNIRQFAQDVLENTADPKLILHFYRALESVTVLDPTCGSGAFLFAALNILEPLYETCLMRMQTFVEEEDRLNAADRQTFRNSFDEFRKILSYVRNPQHPNLRYFIYKSIILQNLYGVDIMREATEIAKLRLFLKLVATVEPDYEADNLGLEPLPDVDFNIRTGNTLIGFATESELDRGLQYTIDGVIAKPGIEEKMELVSMAFDRYKDIQLTHGQDDYEDLRYAKHDLRDRLRELNESLNQLLHKQYASIKFTEWCASHKPFHWLAEFYEIVKSRGGFDVIIGNPPYVEYKDIKLYKLLNYQTIECGNLYAFCSERSLAILKIGGKKGFIIPVASVCTERYESLQSLWTNKGELIISCFNDRPGKLFEGLEHIRLTIVLVQKTGKKQQTAYSTNYLKWHTEVRQNLFPLISYEQVSGLSRGGMIPKMGTLTAVRIYTKVLSNKPKLANYISVSGSHKIYYTRKLSGFVQILDFIPEIYDGTGQLREPSELKAICLNTAQQKAVFLCLLNSSLFYWLLTVWSDCRNLNHREVQGINFDFDRIKQSLTKKFEELSTDLMANIRQNSKMQAMSYRNIGTLNIQCIYPKYSKTIIDEIDKVLAEHYGFTPEEMDFIINYDIKYRMGRDAEGDEE